MAKLETLKKINIYVLYFSGFLDLFAVSMVIPLLVHYCKTLGASHTVAGLISSSYGCVQFFAAPIMGQFSDDCGRKFALQLAMFMCALSYLMMGSSLSLFIIFLSRIPAGIFKHTQELSRGYLSDLVTIDERGNIFGKFNSFSSIGFIFGPLVGGFIEELSGHFSYVILTTSILFLLNFVILTLFLNERIKINYIKDGRKANKIKEPFGPKKLKSVFWIILSLQFFLSFSVFSIRFDPASDMSHKQTGIVMSTGGIIGTLTGFWIQEIINYHNGDNRKLLFHLALIQFFSIFFLTFYKTFIPSLIIGIPLSAVNAVARVAIINITLDFAKKKYVGMIMGMGTSIVALARTLSPILSGFSNEFFTDGNGFLASLSSFLGLMTILFLMPCIPTKFKNS